ncbi:GrpE-domain-containing protein [Flagelloscypha sp. PMI_526]|nr:GrpE-domain-containing protein [Flagelloscypha sp. PMI_526]
MSAAASSLRILRSCTTSVSSASLRRTPISTANLRHARFPLRHPYSTDEAKATTSSESSTTEPPTSPPPPPSPEAEKLAAKEAEVADLKSRLGYVQADFLNLQRNAAREKEQTRDFAITRFAGDLIEVVDVLSLALKSVPSSAIVAENAPSETPAQASTKSPETYLKELHEGVDMTQRLLLQTLFKYHIKPFDPLGDTFDPNRHEALYQAVIPGKTPGTVIDVQKTGYTIKDRILRAAQVGVAQEESS